MSKNKIITISRQSGSGGREIGKKLAEELNIPFYDYKLISLAAKESGYSEELFTNVESKKTTNSLLFSLSSAANARGIFGKSLDDELFAIQTEIVRKVASEGSCVIVGRCADYLLQEDFDTIDVFIYADSESKVRNIMERKKLSEKEAAELVLLTDKRRAAYYNYYTDRKWGRVENYDIAINNSSGDADLAVQIIKSIVNHKWHD